GQRVISIPAKSQEMFVNVQFSPDGHYIIADTVDSEQLQRLNTFDAASGRFVSTITHGPFVITFAFSRVGPQIVTFGQTMDALQTFDVNSGDLLKIFQHSRNIDRFLVSPNGQRIAILSNSIDIRIIDISSRATITTFFGNTLGFSQDGKSVIVGNSDGTAQIR